MFIRAAATVLVLLLCPAAALAADRDRDRMGDAWERKHRVDKPRADRDRDGLTNLREYRLRTNPRRRDSDRDRLRDADELRFGWHPRRRDSDRDGIADGRENAGVITGVDGLRVTIRLAVGGRLAGRLEDPAALACAPAAAPPAPAGAAPEDAGVDDEPIFWDPDWGEQPADLDEGEEDEEPFARTAQVPEDGDEESLDEDEDEGAPDAACQALLRPGTLVREATSELGRDGRRLTRLRLISG